MAKVPFLSEHVNMPRIMLNVESVGLSPEQFFRLCRDNPEMRIELTAQKVQNMSRNVWINRIRFLRILNCRASHWT